MRLVVLLATVSIFAIAPAYAATISVKQDDGTVVKVEMPAAEDAAPAPSEEQQAAPAPEQAPAPKSSGSRSDRIVPTEEQSFQPEVKSRSLRDAMGRPVEKQPVPVAEPAPAPKKGKGKKGSVEAAPVVEPAPVEAAPVAVTAPVAKPCKSKKKSKCKTAEPAPQPAPEYAPPPIQRGNLTEDDAKQIALNAAPPSSSFRAEPKTFEGRNVFVVTFQTENGPYDVLVDSTTGDIVRKGPAAVPVAAPTLPGHLPAPGAAPSSEYVPSAQNDLAAPVKPVKKKAAKKKPKPKPVEKKVEAAKPAEVKAEAAPVAAPVVPVAPPAPAPVVAGPPAP